MLPPPLTLSLYVTHVISCTTSLIMLPPPLTLSWCVTLQWAALAHAEHVATSPHYQGVGDL